jgi:Tfp pilus assembly protein PilP
MKRSGLYSHLSYVVVGLVGLLMAVFFATRFIRPSGAVTKAHAQNAASPSQAPAANPTATPQMNTAAETAAITEGAFLEPYIFDLREGRRNPFRPPQLNEGIISDIMLPGTPLERFELEELKLVGIMWDVKAPKAMIIDPQGEVHVVGKDDRVGRKRGYVAVIREGEVVVVETTTFSGENTYSTRILRVGQ